MSKVKFKTNTNIDTDGMEGGGRTTGRRATGRNTGRSTGRKTGRNSGRATGKQEKAPSEKKKGSGVLAFLVFMILAGGGGAGAFFYLKKQKEVTGYIITKKESDLVRQINKRLDLPTQSVSQLNFILGDIEDFERKYTIPQVVLINEQETEFTSPHIDEMLSIKKDVVESLVAAERDRMRIRDYDLLKSLEEKARIKAEREALLAQRAAEEESRQEAAVQAKADAAAALVAKGDDLDQGKTDVRWEVLDSLMYDRSMFRPLDGKFAFNFISSMKLVDPWVKFPLDKQKNWGNGMSQIYSSAQKTFGIISNSGTDYRGFKMFYEKREGTIMNISKQQFRIRVIDNVEGIEVTRSLDRDIIDIPPSEFHKLLKKGTLPENLKKSTNASKNWDALKKLHEGKSEEQILEFGYASTMYMLKQFPAARKSIESISEISTDLLLEEINEVSPKHNRREMELGLQTAQALYDDGKRQDALMILGKMQDRFEQTKEWSEFKDQFVTLKESALKIKKR
ncbi:MAG: hypothetical protein NE330_10050 [Lentisphaeraceae bacterium]|nr:hypothetical protein [Lentisphaeraceae bacterium]